MWRFILSMSDLLNLYSSRTRIEIDSVAYFDDHMEVLAQFDSV